MVLVPSAGTPLSQPRVPNCEAKHGCSKYYTLFKCSDDAFGMFKVEHVLVCLLTAVRSHDGTHIAYSKALSRAASIICVCNVNTKAVVQITSGLFNDSCPTFDSAGAFVFFASARALAPVPDELHFDYGFPRTQRLYAVALRPDTPSPFELQPLPPSGASESEGEDDEEEDESIDTDSDNSDSGDDDEAELQEAPMAVCADGIQDRIAPFPLPLGQYDCLQGLSDGKLAYVRYAANDDEDDADESSENDAGAGEEGAVYCYDITAGKETTIREAGVADMLLSGNRRVMGLLLDDGARLIAASAGESMDPDSDDSDDGLTLLEVNFDKRLRIQVRLFAHKSLALLFH